VFGPQVYVLCAFFVIEIAHYRVQSAAQEFPLLYDIRNDIKKGAS
jgi:hypothetical protein